MTDIILNTTKSPIEKRLIFAGGPILPIPAVLVVSGINLLYGFCLNFLQKTSFVVFVYLVDLLVLFQTSFLVEALITHLTAEGLFSCMDHLVSLQRTRSLEPLATL